MITIPFDLELAKKINNGERNGMIVTDGDNYRVEFVYHREEPFPILGVIYFVALVRESKGDHRGGGDEEMS